MPGAPPLLPIPATPPSYDPAPPLTPLPSGGPWQGPPGEQGPVGPQGPQGIQGVQGIQGPAGYPGGPIPDPFTATIVDHGGQVYNVKAYGAVGDGVTDDTGAIQGVINMLPPNLMGPDTSGLEVAGGTIFLPPGIYKISSPLLVHDIAGVVIRGAGRYRTVIQPTLPMIGLSAFKFTNTRHCKVEDLWVRGFGAYPNCLGAAFESHVNAPSTVTPLGFTVRDCGVGFLSAGSVIDGIRFTCAPGWDVNDEASHIENVEFMNMYRAGISIEHTNSMQHVFINLIITGAIGVRSESGNFRLLGAYLGCTDADFDLGISGSLRDNVIIQGAMEESGSGQFLRVHAPAGNYNVVTLDNCHVAGVSATDMIIFDAPYSQLNLIGCTFITGSPTANIRVPANTSAINIIGGVHDWKHIYWGGRYTSMGATGLANVTEHPDVDATRVRLGDGLGAIGALRQHAIAAPAIAASINGANAPQKLRGSITFSDATTVGYIDFVPLGSTAPSTEYTMLYSLLSWTGAPAAGAYTIRTTTKDTDGVYPQLSAAPGAGNSITYDWVAVF